jgi:hypothetical protein
MLVLLGTSRSHMTEHCSDGDGGECGGPPACPEVPSPSVEGGVAAGAGFAPPVELAAGPLGAVQAADRGDRPADRVADAGGGRVRRVLPGITGSGAGRARGDEPGALGGRPELLRAVSEWATPELTVALSLSAQAEALHPGHLWPLCEHAAPIEDDILRAAVETEVLAWAAGPGGRPPGGRPPGRPGRRPTAGPGARRARGPPARRAHVSGLPLPVDGCPGGR